MRSWIPVLTVACFLSCSHASAAPQGAAAVQGEAVLQETPEQLQQLVAPIALYPDALVAHERDLGPRTAKVASTMSRGKQDSNWYPLQ